MHKRLICVTLAIVAVMLAGCAKSEASVVGRWQSTITGEITIEFGGDGSITEYWEDDVTNDESTYSVDGDRVTVVQNGDSFELDLEGDRLIYMGETLYTRVA